MSPLFNSAFTADDVDILRGALGCWCTERGVDMKSAEAQFAASTALDLFQSGYDTQDRLLTALRRHRAL